MTAGSDALSLRRRLRAVSRALPLLYRSACRESTFAEYTGHLLLPFSLIGTTSGSRSLRQRALAMGRERARFWKQGWHRTRGTLDTHTVLSHVIASYAVSQVGIEPDEIQRELRRVVRSYTPRELLDFDPRSEDVPADVPDECDLGHINNRG